MILLLWLTGNSTYAPLNAGDWSLHVGPPQGGKKESNRVPRRAEFIGVLLLHRVWYLLSIPVHSPVLCTSPPPHTRACARPFPPALGEGGTEGKLTRLAPRRRPQGNSAQSSTEIPKNLPLLVLRAKKTIPYGFQQNHLPVHMLGHSLLRSGEKTSTYIWPPPHNKQFARKAFKKKSTETRFGNNVGRVIRSQTRG